MFGPYPNKTYDMTRGQAWRAKRNLALASASIQGASLRFLADVFDLHPSAVHRILHQLRIEFPSPGGIDRAAIEAAIRHLRREQRGK